jgi:outer membrane protein assembly factor BamB
LNRSWIRRWPILLAVLVVLLLGASGCGGVRATSWTGLTFVENRLYAADLQQVQVFNAEDGKPIWAFPVDTEKENYRGLFYVAPAVGEGHVVVASQMPPKGFLGQPSNVVWSLDAETGEELWSFGGAGGAYIEGGAISDGTFVIGSSDGNVYALDMESGALKWTFRTGHRVWATPLIVEGTVYIGSMDRHLYALRLSDGEELWQFPAEGDPAKGAFASAPALRDGVLYIGAFDDRFYAINADDGTERWHFEGENWFWGSPAIYGDVVYAIDVSGNVYALDAETGEQVWHRPLAVPVRAGPALVEDGSKLFIGSQNGTLYTLDTVDGTRLWSVEGEGQVLSLPLVNGSLVYEALILGSHRLRALDVDNGREIWVHPIEVDEEE